MSICTTQSTAPSSAAIPALRSTVSASSGARPVSWKLPGSGTTFPSVSSRSTTDRQWSMGRGRLVQLNPSSSKTTTIRSVMA